MARPLHRARTTARRGALIDVIAVIAGPVNSWGSANSLVGRARPPRGPPQPGVSLWVQVYCYRVGARRRGLVPARDEMLMTILSQGPDGALNRLQNMQDLVGKNLNNIVGNLWQRQEEGSGSSHGNMVSCFPGIKHMLDYVSYQLRPRRVYSDSPPLRNVIIFPGTRGSPEGDTRHKSHRSLGAGQHS